MISGENAWKRSDWCRFWSTSWRYNFESLDFIHLNFDSLFDLDAGEYVCPKTTVFGLKRDEVAALIDTGLKVHDKNPEMEGQEIETSGYNVSLLLFEK